MADLTAREGFEVALTMGETEIETPDTIFVDAGGRGANDCGVSPRAFLFSCSGQDVLLRLWGMNNDLSSPSVVPICFTTRIIADAPPTPRFCFVGDRGTFSKIEAGPVDPEGAAATLTWQVLVN